MNDMRDCNVILKVMVNSKLHRLHHLAAASAACAFAARFEASYLRRASSDGGSGTYIQFADVRSCLCEWLGGDSLPSCRCLLYTSPSPRDA